MNLLERIQVSFFLLLIPSFAYVYVIVNDENSTKAPSTREPSVIEIDDENDHNLKSLDETPDETPEEELGKSFFYFPIALAVTYLFVLQNA